MKHKLLLALAGAMMCMSAMAWDAPTKPTKPTFPQYEGTWVDPVNDGNYYIYNVGTGQFLGCGFDWGTRAVTTVEAVLSLDDAQWSCGANKNTIIPFHLHQTDLVTDLLEDETLEGTWQITNLNTNKSANDQYLCHEGNAAWIDGGQSRRDTDKNGFWKIEAAGDAYELLPLDGQEGNSIVYGVHLPNLASAKTVYTWTDLQNNDDAAAKWKFVSTDDVESIREYIAGDAVAAYAEGFDAYNAALTLYNAQLALYNTLLEADKYGADATEAGAVYTNPDATIEELNAANTALQKAIAPLAVEYGCKNSREDAPFEVTNYVMTNPDFSASCEDGKTPPGWEITIKGQNVGQQNRTDTNSETGLAITNFLEAWIPQPGTLGDGYAGQWITGLPAGRYRLEMDATACQQSGAIAIEDLVGVSLFVGTGSYNIPGDPVQTGDRMVQHYTFDFDFNADKLLVGLLVENTNCNWISADNFRLFAIGAMKEDPNKKGLEEAIEKAEEIANNIVGNDIEDAEIFNLNADVAAAFQEAIVNAKTALSGSGDEMKAAVTALGEATEAAKKSNELYKQFQDVYNNALLAAQNFKNNNDQWPELQDEINDYAEVDLTQAFNAGTLTEDDLEEAQGKIDALIAAFLNDPTKIQAGDDLTILVKNADFSQGSGATNIPGWTIASGAITELSATYHNIETYHKAFDFQQTIKNLPAGSYQIGVQGFVRIDSGENDMVLYAGVSEKKFMEITSEYSEHALLGDATDDEGNKTSSGTWPYDTPRTDILADGSTVYVPNSMQGADIYFSSINPATGNPFYLNTVNIAHAGGDLTIGVKCSATNLWILWDNFTLKYLGTDNLIPLLEEIAEKGDELTALADQGSLTEKAQDLIADLQAKIEVADDITSSEEALALISEIKEAIDYIKAGQALFAEISPLVDDYAAKFNELGLTDPAFEALLTVLGDKVAENEYFADNDEIAKGIEDLKKGWIAAVVASAEVGDELKGIILNPDFETGDISNWTDTFTSGNHGFQNNNTYYDEEGNAVISNFAEAWGGSTSTVLLEGSISQEIAAPLPEGYYQLEMDGYAVHQAGEPEGGVQGVYLFAKTGNSIQKVNIGITGTSGVSQHWTLGFYSNGTDLTTVGVMVDGEEVNCNWTAFDNFKLVYYADQVPDAVEGIAVETTAAPKAIFTLDGRQTSTLTRGINIVRKADGSVQKVLVK